MRCRYLRLHSELVLTVLLLITLGLAGCQQAATLTAADEAAVYAAAIREQYGPDDTFGGTLQAPILYLVSQTDDGIGDPDLEEKQPRALPDSLQDAIATRLSDLPAAIVWVSNQADVSLDADSGAVAGGGVVIRLGNLHAQNDGSVLVSTSIYVAGLAAGGQTYVVEQVNGDWVVTGNTGVQWIS
jgi:uncharacterized protein YceK